MKKFIIIVVLAIVAGTGNIYAQYAADGLRFSQTNYGSSARFKGMGNAQISLGGDISSIGGNPAGLGMFTKSEFSLTPEFDNSQAKANYLGQNSSATKNQLNLSQVGAVWYSPVVKPVGSDLNKGLISAVFGIGYNRNNDFSSRVNYGGQNASSSIGDSFAQMANGASSSDNLQGLPSMAYQSFLIDQTTPGSATSYARATSLNNNQRNYEARSGSTSELDFSGGLNFSNKFYLGASIGVVNVRYTSDSEFDESGTNTSTSEDNDMSGRDYDLSYRQSQVTDGSGINARVGLIYKPISTVRIGATFQSPTWMHIEDNSAEVLDTRYTSGSTADNFNSTPDNFPFEYSLRTPYKGSLGGSVILGGHALLSADVDYVDYGSIKFSTAANNDNLTAFNTVTQDNIKVKDAYTSAINYRIGGEYKLGQVSLRAGFGLNGSPYKDDDANTFDTKYYSGGLGYRFNQYYFDLAYQRVETNSTYVPYTLDAEAMEPTAYVKNNKNNVFLTLGVNF